MKKSSDDTGKQPSFPLHVSDLGEELGKLSLEAGCAWVKMLLRMHYAPERGYLIHANGQPYNDTDMCRLIGVDAEKVRELISELERCGTFSIDNRGVIFNRRMVRESAISVSRRMAAHESWKRSRPTPRETRTPPVIHDAVPEEDPRVLKFPTIKDPMVMFEELIGAALAAGKMLSEPNRIAAAHEWVSMPANEYPLAVADYCKKCTDGTWTQARYVPYPHNYLKSKSWAAVGPGRILPEVAKKSKGDLAQEAAMEALMKEATG